VDEDAGADTLATTTTTEVASADEVVATALVLVVIGALAPGLAVDLAHHPVGPITATAVGLQATCVGEKVGAGLTVVDHVLGRPVAGPVLTPDPGVPTLVPDPALLVAVRVHRVAPQGAEALYANVPDLGHLKTEACLDALALARVRPDRRTEKVDLVALQFAVAGEEIRSGRTKT